VDDFTIGFFGLAATAPEATLEIPGLRPQMLTTEPPCGEFEIGLESRLTPPAAFAAADCAQIHTRTTNNEHEDRMSEHIHHVTDDTFEAEVLQSQGPVLVDYWAEWCGPCKAIAPTLEEVAKEYTGKLKVAKVNVDENQEIPRKYGIRGIPTLMLFKNGNIEATKVGALSKSQLTAFLDSNI
jgi:thioredoxin 1